MQKIAVLLTVYNRINVTKRGLMSLFSAMKEVEHEYSFDVYMVDDGSSDGTSKMVLEEFPDVNIFYGDGNLFWSGGMRKAWEKSTESGVIYDFFLWYNDDVELFNDAISILFNAFNECGENCIVTGACHDHYGKPSYGGKLVEDHIMEPNGTYQDVVLMNGNFVLIPLNVYLKVGTIDKVYKHGLGDYDYGLRAQQKRVKIKLTSKYIGICDRHDLYIPSFLSKDLNIAERFRLLYSPQNNPFCYFVFIKRYYGFLKALKFFITRNIYTLLPYLFVRQKI